MPIAIVYVALTAAAVLSLLPLYALLAAAMNPAEQWAGGIAGLWPKRWDASAVATAWGALGAGRGLVNGLIAAIAASTLGLAACTLAAYGLVRTQFAGQRLLTRALMLAAALPPAAYAVAVWRAATVLRLWDTRLVVALFLAAQPLTILMLRAYIRRLPSDMLDAARLDGLSDIQILKQMVLPLIRRGLLAAGVLHFAVAWNSLTVPLALIDTPEKQPLTQLAADLARRPWLPWSQAAAAALLSALPVLLLFALCHRALIAEAMTWAGAETETEIMSVE
jgi:ABC-type glycerol-3-phosphate transport system permease component